MTKILFVCLGNICRSPMAEYVMKDLVRKSGLEDKFMIQSAATCDDEIGNGMHHGTRKKLEEVGIQYGKHSARQLTAKDYDQYDYLIGMEESNIRNMKRILGQDRQNKVYRLLDFSKNPRDIADPWYTGNFDKTYDDVLEGCQALLDKIKEDQEK